MRKLMLGIFLLTALVTTREAWAHGEWGLVDGTAAAPSVIRGNTTPTVTRTGTGSYRLQFGFTVEHILVTSQTLGPAGDATPTLASVVKDSANPRVIYVRVYAIANGGSPNTTQLSPTNARFSFVIRR